MADLTIIPANVVSGAGTITEYGTAGATITAGQVVYKGPTGRYLLADANSATAAARSPLGIALNGASDGQPLKIHKAGPLTIGATLVPGTAYHLSDDGGICLLADVTGGDYIVQIGLASSASVINVDFQIPNVATA